MGTANPESERILLQLRQLNLAMNPAMPDVVQIRQFRDLFETLDKLLRTGATLPPSWITHENRNQLPTEVTHTITHFHSSQEERLRELGLAGCGHPSIQSTEYCLTKHCDNYIHKHKKPNLNKG